MALRVAVVGAGPAGFFTAEELLRRDGYEVDLLDALPTPFGLVRSGVAPDHPKIKTVTRRYARTAEHPGFRFFGGVEVGADVTRDELRERYDAVVYAVGARDDRRLGIDGEDRPGSRSATSFVAWYNGHPEHADEAFDLSGRRAVVVGNGNVALDVARMLVLGPDALAVTDTADHALARLATSGVEEVVVLGRRGPAQAAFTNPELVELGEIAGCDVVVDPADVELDPASARWLAEPGRALAARRLDHLRAYADRAPTGAARRIELRFLRSPIAILGDGPDGHVTGIRLARNRIEATPSGDLRPVATGEEETLDCGLVLRSVGYRGRRLPGLPFDDARGVIHNDAGRVTGEDGEPWPGEYVTGWIKRGPSGVIGTNKKCAVATVQALVADAEGGRLGDRPGLDRTAVTAWLRDRVDDLVPWAGWNAIDAHEVALGAPQGRPRVKLVRVPELLAATRH